MKLFRTPEFVQKIMKIKPDEKGLAKLDRKKIEKFITEMWEKF